MIVIIMPMLASPGISARTLAMTPSCRLCHVFSWGGGDGVSLVGRCFLLFTQSPAAAYLLLQTWLPLTYTQLPPSSTQLPLSHSLSPTSTQLPLSLSLSYPLIATSYPYPATSLPVSLSTQLVHHLLVLLCLPFLLLLLSPLFYLTLTN